MESREAWPTVVRVGSASSNVRGRRIWQRGRRSSARRFAAGHAGAARTTATSALNRWLTAALSAVLAFGVLSVVATQASSAAPSTSSGLKPHTYAPPTGYWLMAKDGGVFAFGNAGYHGSMGGHALNAPIVGGARTASSNGYWEVASDGGVFTFGDAGYFGSMGGKHLNAPIVGMAATPDGQGYWLVASDGGIFAFGDAVYRGSMGGHPLNQPIVGMSATGTGNGYWLVASDGGVFTFGDATFHGSTGGKHLNAPIVGIAGTQLSNGYWLVASDGGIFAFGTATFHGSMGSKALNSPIVGMSTTSDFGGYTMVAADGGVFTFGDAAYHGSAVTFNAPSGAQSVGIIPVGSGYWVPNDQGQVDALGAPAAPQPSFPVTVTSTPVSPNRLPPSVNPAASTAPSAAFSQACWTPPVNNASCDAAALTDINQARAAEGYGPLPLPGNYESLPMGTQLVVVADAERTSRGLPSLPENANLDLMAQAGAQAGADPTGPGGYAWGSNIAWGDPTPLAADFGWMYDDGLGSENIDCNYAGAPGCWGHRENILSPWGGQAGGGVFNNGGQMQLTQLFVANYP